jgi:elongation factor 1-alpha
MLQVDHTFEVRGVGSVVSGTAVSGSIAVGQRLLLGPNADGDFTNVVVSGIQRSQVLTPTALL